MTKSAKRRAFIAVAAVAILAWGTAFALKSNAFYMMSHHMSGHEGMHNGAHDEVNMPGLRGKNVTEQETAEMAAMFRNFGTLTREVEILPNGIRTVTRSSEPAVMDQLISHVIGMVGRVDAGDNPEIFIQSPTLDIFLPQGDKVTSDIEVNDAGVVVIRTSENPELVSALHEHAVEVTAMADRGMAAVHDKMSGNH